MWCAWIEEGVRRLYAPQVMNSAGQQPQHAARALERAERSGLLSQHFKQLGMQRVAARELVAEFRVGGVGR
jgi:hypothetical protein